tara:strand:+ start:194 stop:949 length:756 start_codon:yes stop_codon:yes gene_type:complete
MTDIKPLKDQIAIVTGASKGIGKAIAKELSNQGAKIVINYNSDHKSAEQISNEINKTGGESIKIQTDVSDENAVSEMIKKTISKFQKIDILVNNAGITKDKLAIRMTSDDWNKVITTNLNSTFLCTKYTLPYMLKAKYGRIINISSVVGMTGNPGQSNYSASKAGLIGFTKSIAREVGTRNITSNAIAPGYISTEMTNAINPNVQEKILANIPMNRFGSPEEIAQLVGFLSSDKAAYITGQTLVIDGGLTA